MPEAHAEFSIFSSLGPNALDFLEIIGSADLRAAFMVRGFLALPVLPAGGGLGLGLGVGGLGSGGFFRGGLGGRFRWPVLVAGFAAALGFALAFALGLAAGFVGGFRGRCRGGLGRCVRGCGLHRVRRDGRWLRQARSLPTIRMTVIARCRGGRCGCGGGRAACRGRRRCGRHSLGPAAEEGREDQRQDDRDHRPDSRRPRTAPSRRKSAAQAAMAAPMPAAKAQSDDLAQTVRRCQMLLVVILADLHAIGALAQAPRHSTSSQSLNLPSRDSMCGACRRIFSRHTATRSSATADHAGRGTANLRYSQQAISNRLHLVIMEHGSRNWPLPAPGYRPCPASSCHRFDACGFGRLSASPPAPAAAPQKRNDRGWPDGPRAYLVICASAHRAMVGGRQNAKLSGCSSMKTA